MEYEIEPQNESRGEGNGWYKCDDKDAVMFAIFKNGVLVATAATKQLAEDAIKDGDV